MLVKNQKGFSLVEIIAALAVLGIIAITIFTTVGILSRNQQYATRLQQTTQIGQTVLENLVNEHQLPAPTATLYAGMEHVSGSYPNYQGKIGSEAIELEFLSKQSLAKPVDVLITLTQVGTQQKVTMVDKNGSTTLAQNIETELVIEYRNQKIIVRPQASNSGNTFEYPCSELPIIELKLEAEPLQPIKLKAPETLMQVRLNKPEAMSQELIQPSGNLQLIPSERAAEMGVLYTVQVTVAPSLPEQFTTKQTLILAN